MASARPTHAVSYGRFILKSLKVMTDGNFAFYAWMTVLTAIMLVGVNAWAHQIDAGMAVTHMTDHVSWGLYIANFTFMVGLAAGAVMMVIPAYLYRDKAMHDVVIVGELLAVAAIVMCLAFVTVDLGRPDRFWHLIPGMGRFNWPMSMLTWDVIVLNVYLLLNLHVASYLVYTRFRGKQPNRRWYLPFVFISIVWAISIHTVTAFLYSGLGGRPFWNTAILAPRFIASAFVTGPAFIILTLQVLERVAGLKLSRGPILTLTRILRVTILLNLFMLLSEVFTQFYTGGHHASPAEYLYFGLDGHNALVPWIWTAIILNTGAALVLLTKGVIRSRTVLNVACIMAFIGVWIEKGMGLIVPGFIPSTMGEMVEYTPSLVEWQITAGIWAMGLIIFTLFLKVAVPVVSGDLRMDGPTDSADEPSPVSPDSD